MNIVIDDGNTRTKTATFAHYEALSVEVCDSDQQLMKFLQVRNFENVIVSSVRRRTEDILTWVRATNKKIALTSKTPLPFQINYKTPESLGVDRIAAAAGAMDLFPDRNCLVIDAGTCVTYEFIRRDRVYLGGAISPGVRMRFEAMHRLTASLPLVDTRSHPDLIGRSTEECMQSGVINGMREEIRGIITRYSTDTKDLQVVLCGGDASLFENIDKPSIFVAPNLVLQGLRAILMHNVAE